MIHGKEIEYNSQRVSLRKDCLSPAIRFVIFYGLLNTSPHYQQTNKIFLIFLQSIIFIWYFSQRSKFICNVLYDDIAIIISPEHNIYSPSTTHCRFVLKKHTWVLVCYDMTKPPMNTVKNRSFFMFRYRLLPWFLFSFPFSVQAAI